MENEGEERERVAYSAVSIPLDLFVYITLSLSAPPLLFPSVSCFHLFLLLCVFNTNTHMVQPLYSLQIFRLKYLGAFEIKKKKHQKN